MRTVISLPVNRMLPKIDMGDYIIIHDTGAHGFSMGYNYNGKLRSAEVAAEGRWFNRTDQKSRDTYGLLCNL